MNRIATELLDLGDMEGCRMWRRVGGALRSSLIIFGVIFTIACMTRLARAEVLVTCGPSAGFAYYSEYGVIDRDNAGWTEDGIAGGETSLLFDPSNSEAPFDVLYTDSTGGTRTAKSDAGSVSALAIDSEGILLVIVYDGLIETYHFTNSNLIITQSKHQALILKDAIFVSECEWHE
jgi:hypothetical protein